MLSKASAALETMLDTRAPAWRRAAAAAVLIELADLVPCSIPASLALRIVILRAVFEASGTRAPVPVDTASR